MDKAAPLMASPHLPFTWLALAISFLATLCFLPAAKWRNAVLVGTGLAFGSIPLLHLIYNAFTKHLPGPGWNTPSASFGPMPLLLGAAGVVILPIWWWRRHPVPPSERAGPFAIAASIVFLLALAPCTGDVVSNLSLHTLYALPDSAHLPFTGADRVRYINWKLVDFLYASIYLLAGIMPLVFLPLAAIVVVFLRGLTRNPIQPRDAASPIFPTVADLPWLLVLASTGLAWGFAHTFEMKFSGDARDTFRAFNMSRPSYDGMESVVLISAALFFICQYEWARRLHRAARARLFYSAMPLLLVGLGAALNYPWFAPLGAPAPFAEVSDEPAWLSWLLESAVVVLAASQALALFQKIRRRALEISLWKFDSTSLVPLGLLTGLIIAVCGLALWLVAIELAYESTIMISALLAWSRSLQGSSPLAYHPQEFLQKEHLTSWLVSSPLYLCGCLVAGLTLVLIASALEFIRFNGFRLYRVRKARRHAPQILATND
jgi:hypothetical protein